MRIDTEISSFDYLQRSRRLYDRGLFPPVNAVSGEVAVRNEQGSLSEGADFTRMTRRELFDWTKRSVATGAITSEESVPFMAMTVQLSPEGRQIWSSERVDFVQEMRRAVAEAQYRRDYVNAGRFENALHIMQRALGLSARLDIHA